MTRPTPQPQPQPTRLRLNITLSPEAVQRIDAIARARGQTRSAAIEQMIRRARVEGRGGLPGRRR